MSGTNMFRTDIEGLRGAAVLSVVLFHLGVPGLSGGFVGVDVFFVISGFLIARIIETELQEGSFSVANFYLRRTARIIPALLVLLVVVGLVAGALFFGELLRRFGVSLLGSALFFSNFVYAAQSGYFSEEAEKNPLLHTWSLSVEEQYYLVIPVLLFLVHGRRSQRVHWAVFALSFAAALALGDRDKAFFFSPTRFWEFSSGSLAGVYAAAISPRVRQVAAQLGLVLVLLSIFFLHGRTMSPIPAPFFAVLGASAVISAEGAGLAGRALSLSPLRFLGRISYSVYLWHWPLIVLWHYYKITELEWSDQLALGLLSLLLGYASWRWVEVPARRALILAPGRLLRPVAAFGGLVILLGVGYQTSKLERNVSPEARRWASYGGVHGAYRRCLEDGVAECRIGAPDRQPSFVLWGDSFAASLADELDVLAREQQVSGLLVLTHACPPLHGATAWWRPAMARCLHENERALTLARDPAIKQLIMHANWREAVEAPDAGATRWSVASMLGLTLQSQARALSRFEERFRATLERLQQGQLTVVVVTHVPRPVASVPSGLAVRSMLHHDSELGPNMQRFRAVDGPLEKILLKVAHEHGALTVQPWRDLCPGTQCRVESQGVPWYFDGSHLNVHGAKQLLGLRSILSRATASLPENSPPPFRPPGT